MFNNLFSKKELHRRIVSVILALTMMLSSCITASAVSVENQTSDWAEPASTNSACGVGRWYLGHFSFYDENYGAYRTINGNSMRLCIAWKPIDGLDGSTQIFYQILQYHNVPVQQGRMYMFQDEPDADGYYYFELPWVSIINGVDYRFFYRALTDGSGTPRRVDCHVWIDVK